MGETVATGKTSSEIISHIAALFLLYIFIFILGAFSGYFMGGWLFGDYMFIPLIPGGFSQASDCIPFICNVLKSAVIQCLLLFIGGILLHPTVIPCAVFIYRGFCVGCVLKLCQISLLYSSDVPVFLSCYFLATVFLVLFAGWATVRLQVRLRQIVFREMKRSSVYLFRFLSVSGIVFFLYCAPFWIIKK